MNIKQIAYMVATVERGSLSSAAKELYVTVQAVSKAIADLERELGRSLFVRESRGMHPTPFGLAFYERADAVLRGFERLEDFARTYEERGGLPDHLRLALNTPAFPGNELVRENTVAFMKSRLGIDVVYELATGSAGYAGLANDTYDAIVTVGAFRHPDVVCSQVGTVPAGVMMGAGHPLAERNKIALADLVPYPVALSKWFDSANDTIVEAYRARGTELNFVDLTLDRVLEFLACNGVIFTTGIPALGRMDPRMTVRVMAPEDAIAVPLCVASLKSRSAAVRAVVEKLLSSGGVPFLT